MDGVTSDRNTTQSRFPPSAQYLITDVLVEIFLQCSLGENVRSEWEVEGRREDFYPKPSIHSSPLILGRVCQSWREVALSTPQLWSRLCIPESWNSVVGMEEWMKRSGSAPLTFQLCDTRHPGDEPVLDRTDTLKVLLANTHRWKHIDVQGSTELISLFLRSLALDQGAPLLETLEIRDYHNWRNWDEVLLHFELDSPKYPRLTSLRLPESVMVSLQHSNVVLHNLRNIWFGAIDVDRPGAMSMDDYLLLLALCPNLEDASFTIADPSPVRRIGGIIERKISKLRIWLAPDWLPTGQLREWTLDLSLTTSVCQTWSNFRIDLVDEVTGNLPWSHLKSLLRRQRPS
ncbi:hypothetical protein BD410DRAFT_131257 [Rickenella mellea]|uniref:Uncharacterized protein n=1 Tax=Rickenella mellea TaxID=50990 RepID=A0A4Y7QAU8_9AGAM|nr:hypothetical protein BD410DRAFT_131257 [Rickenella mellea]